VKRFSRGEGRGGCEGTGGGGAGGAEGRGAVWEGGEWCGRSFGREKRK